ncbi:MAG: UDP-N-acetylmuramoyl-tripeptide--D-alanyl-D-alanine ligase [Phycisphaerae bacterium]|nr:UDP-N-acetylmuramoyl-tripeptide--D-alanyl-D-alanine ligase [Phycisphaerae bacterium]
MSEFLLPARMREATQGRWLAAGLPDCAPTGVCTDTRDAMQGTVFLALRGERFDAHDFLNDAEQAGAAMLIVEREPARAPRIPVLVVQSTRTALGDLARAWRAKLTSTRVIAVTGSAGKTTTCRLIDGVLATERSGSASRKSFNNDIGVPLTILAARRGHQYLVLEIGMNHPGEIAALAAMAQPDIAVITMIGRVHLEGLGSEEAIAVEKSSLLDGLAPAGVAIINGDSAMLAAAMRQRPMHGRKLVRFGRDAARPLEVRLTGRNTHPSGQTITVNGDWSAELRLPGEHNAVNALAAIAVGRAFGVSDVGIRMGLASVAPAAMRMERVERDGIVFFNDAYNANPDAMAASIRTFAEITPDAPRRVIVLGDMLELGDAAAALHREVGAEAAAVDRVRRLHAAILVGTFAPHTHEGLRSAGWSGDALVVPALNSWTLPQVLGSFRAGDAVLLKGSRGSAMERVLTAAAAVSSHSQPTPSG